MNSDFGTHKLQQCLALVVSLLLVTSESILYMKIISRPCFTDGHASPHKASSKILSDGLGHRRRGRRPSSFFDTSKIGVQQLGKQQQELWKIGTLTPALHFFLPLCRGVK